jgi:hypothetical protein
MVQRWRVHVDLGFFLSFSPITMEFSHSSSIHTKHYLSILFSLGKFNETVRTPCMHRFCRSCLDMALKRRRMCPLCNKVLNTRRSIMPSYLFDELTHIYETIKKAYEEDHYGQSLSQEVHYYDPHL